MGIKYLNIFIIGIGLLLGGHSASYGQSGSYTIKGKIKDWMQPQQVVLSYLQNGQSIEDTTETKNGRFTFKGTLIEPLKVTVYRISSNRHQVRDSRTFFIEPGTF